MSKTSIDEDLKKFASILAAPIFSNIRETNGGSDNGDGGAWLRTDALRENHVLSITCDRCEKTGIYYYVHSYTDLEHDFCVPCYNEMREAVTPSGLVTEAKKFWAAMRDYAAKKQARSYTLACATQPNVNPRPVHSVRISRAEVLAEIEEVKEEEQREYKRKRMSKKKDQNND